jgi:isopenicillin-N epimerase
MAEQVLRVYPSKLSRLRITEHSPKNNSGGHMNRRSFMVHTGAMLGAAATAGVLPFPLISAETSTPPTEPAFSNWDAVRAQFNLAPNKINMACLWHASHPKPVREAIEQHRRGLDECPFEYFEENAPRLEAAVRTAAAEYLADKPDNFAMTGNTTQGLATIYNGLKLRPGQEILSTEQDHIVTKTSLRLRAERVGTPVRTISLYDRSDVVTEDELVEAVIQALTPQTRVVAITWVQSATGVKMPVGRIAQELTRLNLSRAEEDQVLLSVDGLHGFGVEDFTVSDLGCDFFIAGCHKWLFGSRGTGLIWGNSRAWRSVVATIPTMDPLWRHVSREQLIPAAWMTPGGFHAFEHRWALTEAFRFHMQIGKARVAARIHELNRQCKEGLVKMPHVKLQTPLSDKLSAGMVCFEVDGLTPTQTVERLKDRGIVASTTPPYKYEYARVTPSLWNTPAEVEATLRAIHSLR